MTQLPPCASLQVQSLLDRTATGGMDWGNCCVYGITEEGGAVVQPEVRCVDAWLPCWVPAGGCRLACTLPLSLLLLMLVCS